ncbi:unnamed protein product [Spodoptera exigua]|nr:unnamed protein product [Spodoptera exigua]
MESTSVFEDRENLNDFLEEAELQQYYELFRDILKVTKVSQLKFVLTEDLVQIGLSRPEQRRYKKIYSKYFPNPYISKIRKMLKPSRKRDQNFHGHTSIPLEMQPVFENNVKVPTKHIISIEDITINKELGMGQFGVVQQGTWTTGNQRLQVAIKCLGHERMTSNSTEFLKEAAVMHSIEHPNIVRLYGVVLHLDSLMLVTELAPLRSLLECLREVSLRLNFPVPNLCEFAEQICDGMSYLESKRLIHRDLAARNILVFSKDRVKISDFGLSRALGVGKDYYQTNYNVNLKLPVAWCAPECILFLRFTSASDVWAFGVCLWEMFTYGFQPWAAFSGQQILEAIDAPNFQRLERPECCPEAYYATMLECWAHDFNNRPKFKDLSAKLATIRPEQVQATVNFQKPEDGRRNTFLEYKTGQVITVLGKENMTKCPLWYGVLPGGACGMFDPTQTKPYTPPEPPRQVVTPYKPSEDLEQVPLINPNSPSHLSGASGTTPYPMLASNKPDTRNDADEVDLSCDVKTRSLKKNRTLSEPTTSKGILSKVRSATLGRSHKADNATVPKTDEVHEYHEISDTDTDGTAASLSKSERLALRPDSLDILKNSTDFSQSLLEELDIMFKNLETRKKEESSASSRQPEPSTRLHTLTKAERKKGFSTTTMKPMSAHDEKNLNTAIALANEITSKSMNDLEDRHPQSPSERKFNFRFGRSGHHSTQTHEPEREHSAGYGPRRNFSDEAKSVPDLASTITAESKLAYASLIEEPTPSTSLMTQIAKETGGILKSATIPKPTRTAMVQYNNRTVGSPHNTRSPICSPIVAERPVVENTYNILPLPPRTTKPKLVDKPRHVRKYPLKLVDEPKQPPTVPPTMTINIYQNTKSPSKDTVKPSEVQPKSEDVVDTAKDTNPFLSAPGPSNANPFGTFLDNDHDDDDIELELNVESDTDSEEETHTKLAKGTLSESKDHVSVEDLLEFADQKPCGRQRGVESDEVRIMSKVLKDEASQEQCLEALELSGWNVHNAIKLVRVKVSVGTDVSFDKCHEQLQKTNGDIVKAVSMMVSLK